MQNQPDQLALSVGDGPDRLIVSQARDRAAIHDLEDASFDFYGRVSSLIEQAPHVTVALRGPVTVVHAGALLFAGGGTDPRREAFLGGKRRCGRADFGNDLLRGVHCETRNFR
jgi:hypothetical protein